MESKIDFTDRYAYILLHQEYVIFIIFLSFIIGGFK